MSRQVESFVGLGSNLGRRRDNLRFGIEGLRRLPGWHELAVSPAYETAPVGKLDQGAFVNAVARGLWNGSSLQLLEALLEIEAQAGRVRRERWGPRTLDLDLLLFGGGEIAGERLTVPHPELARRAFVLVPLRDLAPELVVPGLGRSVERLWAEMEPAARREQRVEKIAWDFGTW